MKGLLIKDFKLIGQQKTFFYLLLAVVIGLVSFSDDIAFPLYFMTFSVSLFALTTTSYDELDNGSAFLFTLPLTRGKYALEKYILAVLLSFSSWVAALLLAIVAASLRGMAVKEIVITAIFVFPLVVMMQAIMLPIQLKFGAEKGRIAMIASIAGLVVLGIVLLKAAKLLFNIDLANLLTQMPALSAEALAALLTLAALLILAFSLKVSIGIMKAKEF
ncbi:ABC-2 transporter permease [Streptococcus caviae]|uniref:ABC-2 transporter permease n=1 Tax=Streptococcus sp. 'caviae' TaxID=1915004 RepID=UPI00094B9618|nr:ABC-2 transporter permease [Streptococcus sp. 'caviae']OLN83789.1 hypothetical protein BMI76_03675 [Streptococcus sp. 'caviae']